MTTGLTIIYNSFLYYCCLLLVTYYIICSTPRKGILFGSFLLFIPFAVTAVLGDRNIFIPTYLVFVVSQFLLIRMSFRTVKLRYPIFTYILLYCVNMILTSPVAAIVPQHYLLVDFIINTLTATACGFICTTKKRYAIRRILEWTPKYILHISVLLLISAAAVSALISGFNHSNYPEIVQQWIQVITSLLLMAICVVVPIIFIISISNTRLKTLTAEYEQQIHAQAEHYKNLAAANYEVRRFRHDFKNMRIAIEKLLTDGQYEQALELIRQCGDAMESPNGFRSVFDTGNGIADALLTDKQNRAAAYDTVITFDGVIPPDALSPTDLCVILGNSLDNSLDACQKLSGQGPKTISVTSQCNSGFLFLTITNPIAEKVVIRNNQIATTKENKTLHGFGLYSLHTIVKKYEGELQLSATDDTFTISIDLCITSAARK